MTPEGEIKKNIKKALKLAGKGIYWFMPVQTGYGKSSLDFLVCQDGKFLAIEAKREGKTLTPRQRRVAQQIKDAGGDVWLVEGDKWTKL